MGLVGWRSQLGTRWEAVDLLWRPLKGATERGLCFCYSPSGKSFCPCDICRVNPPRTTHDAVKEQCSQKFATFCYDQSFRSRKKSRKETKDCRKRWDQMADNREMKKWQFVTVSELKVSRCPKWAAVLEALFSSEGNWSESERYCRHHNWLLWWAEKAADWTVSVHSGHHLWSWLKICGCK